MKTELLLNWIKEHRKYIVIGLIPFVLLISLIGNIVRYYKVIDMQIEDLNGDDKSLCVLTDEDIRAEMQNFRSIKSHMKAKKNQTTGVVGKFEDYDGEYVETQFKMLSGIYVCSATVGNGQTITWKIDSKVHSGNLRIVITNENCEILQEVPIDQTTEVSLQSENNESYYVKLVGESAEIEVMLWRTIAE